MHLPQLQSISKSHFYVSGDAIVEEGAAIAPGVILQADPGSRIIIAPGVCIGMGAIVHACFGTIEIDSGANLGAGVLVVGKGKIGANACVGAASTIFNCDVAAQQIVQAGSLLGDVSRPVALTSQEELSSEEVASPASSEEASPTPSPPAAPRPPSSSSPPPSQSVELTSEYSSTAQTIVYSQRQLNRLMVTLFPNGQYFRSYTQNGPSAEAT